MSVERLLVACRGRLARRLVRTCAEQGIESVATFSEPDADQAYLDDADFDAYLNGRAPDATYHDPGRMVAAAMDAGCDAIHPGVGPLAGSPGLVTQAANANVGVIGPDPQHLLDVVERARLLEHARQVGLDPVPAASLPPGADPLSVAASLGTPLRVVGSHGGAERRIDDLGDLEEAVAVVRSEAAARAGEGGVILLRDDDAAVRLSTVVVGDRHGPRLHLGVLDRSVRHRGRDWLVELGPPADGWPMEILHDGAVRLAERVQWIGVGELSFLLHDGRAWVQEWVPHLPDAWDLVEAVHGVDVVAAQHEAVVGRSLQWEQPGEVPTWGAQVRLWHGDPVTGEVGEGTLVLDPGSAAGVEITHGVDPGTPCSSDTEPLLCAWTAVGPDRKTVLDRLREALAGTTVSGVATNLEPLRALLSSDEIAERRATAHTVAAWVEAHRSAGR